MKNLIFLVTILASTIMYSQATYPGQSFRNGYKAGYIKGFCAEEYGCSVNEYSIKVPRPNPGYESYNDGYTRGIADGSNAKAGNGSASGSKKIQGGLRQIVDPISSDDAAAIYGTSSSEQQQTDLGDAFMDSYKAAVAAREAEEAKRRAAMSPPSKDLIVPMNVDLNNYSKIAVVDANNTKSLYKTIEKILINSPLKVINPKTYDKKKFKKDIRFLRDIKDESWVYLYYSKTMQGYDEIRTIVLRDYKNKIIYHSKTINISFAENFSPLINF